MIDMPIEMPPSPSTTYLDLALAEEGLAGVNAGGWDGRGLEGEGGNSGGVQSLFNEDNYWNMTDSGSMVQSDGYVLADYDGDGQFDQAWWGRDGDWYTTTDGETWRSDDGPLDEWEWLQRRENI